MSVAPVRIGDLGKVVTGRTPPAAKPEYFGTEHPFITPTDIQGDARYLETIRSLSDEGLDAFRKIALPTDTVCVVCIGATIGKVCMTRQPSVTNQQINAIVVDKSKYDPFFVFAAVRQLQEELKAKAGGAATPIINKSSFEDIEILVPELNLQRRIAGILSAYDDLIEVNQRRVAIVEDMARRLFDQWFVRFRYPGHEAVPLVETEAGMVPVGWTLGTVQDVVVLQRGFDLPNTQRSDGPYPVIAATGEHGLHKEFKVRGPGIVTGRSGSLGKVMHISGDFWPLNTTLWGKDYPLGSTYFAYFTVSNLPFDTLNAGAAVPSLNRNHVHLLPQVVPPHEVVALFDNSVAPMFALKRSLLVANARLRQARDLVLPKLISGEIAVSAAEENFAEAAE
ncbi:MAG: restriction endonuclease subunit S [Allorhizobium sp.]